MLQATLWPLLWVHCSSNPHICSHWISKKYSHGFWFSRNKLKQKRILLVVYLLISQFAATKEYFTRVLSVQCEHAVHDLLSMELKHVHCWWNTWIHYTSQHTVLLLEHKKPMKQMNEKRRKYITCWFWVWWSLKIHYLPSNMGLGEWQAGYQTTSWVSCDVYPVLNAVFSTQFYCHAEKRYIPLQLQPWRRKKPFSQSWIAK